MPSDGALVATVLTACGMETLCIMPGIMLMKKSKVATVLTACGIETLSSLGERDVGDRNVATVLTACGIETFLNSGPEKPVTDSELQQYLPLAVLKPNAS